MGWVFHALEGKSLPLRGKVLRYLALELLSDCVWALQKLIFLRVASVVDVVVWKHEIPLVFKGYCLILVVPPDHYVVVLLLVLLKLVSQGSHRVLLRLEPLLVEELLLHLHAHVRNVSGLFFVESSQHFQIDRVPKQVAGVERIENWALVGLGPLGLVCHDRAEGCSILVKSPIPGEMRELWVKAAKISVLGGSQMR